jgi:hypothetical protein
MNGVLVGRMDFSPRAEAENFLSRVAHVGFILAPGLRYDNGRP